MFTQCIYIRATPFRPFANIGPMCRSLAGKSYVASKSRLKLAARAVLLYSLDFTVYSYQSLVII